MGCAQKIDSFVGRDESMELDEIVGDACWDLPSVQVSVAYHAPAFEDVCGSISVRNGSSDYIELMVCTLRARFHQLKVKVTLGVKCSAIKMVLKKSDISHIYAQRGVIASQLVRKGSPAE